MKGARKQKIFSKSKPSQASLVSRGLAVNPALVRCNEDGHSSPSSVQSGFSLYSSDSENTAVGVNRGLNRCAKLLANILDTDQGHSVKTGHATYKHQGQKPKINNKTRKNTSIRQESKSSKGHQKNPVQGGSTKVSQAKTGHVKNPKRKDAPTSTTSTSKGKSKGHELSEPSGKGQTSAHIIPTGSSNGLTAKSGASLPSTVPKLHSSSKNLKHATAPGFQNCLMSSTPEQRESPQKLIAAAPNETPKLYVHHSQQGQQPSTNRDHHQHLGTNKQPVILPREDSVPQQLKNNSPVSLGTKRNSSEGVIESKQGQEPDMDYMQWYEKPVAKQALYNGCIKDCNTSLQNQNSKPDTHLSSSKSDIMNISPGHTAFPTQYPIHDLVSDHSQHHNKKVYQPLKDSQGLLRDLVQQMTILNQSHKNSDSVFNTRDILQGLIQSSGHAQLDRLGSRKDTDQEDHKPVKSIIGGSQHLIHADQQQGPNQDPDESNEQPSLRQLLSDFRQISSLSPPVGQGQEGEVHPSASPKQTIVKGESPPQVTFITPMKDQLHYDNKMLNQGTTPYVRDDGLTIPHVEPDRENLQSISSPPRSSEPLIMDPRGTAIRQRSMQQIRTLKHLIGELQAVLADHGDREISRLLNELEETCNTLPYTTQKQLLDLNTEVLLAFQPLQSENSQLRRRLRIANHQLRRREMVEKENKDEAAVSMELLTIQALNANLQKQLREERRVKEQLRKDNLEMSQMLDEKEQRHKDMLRIMDDKDSNLLKSRQDCLKELQDLRSEGSDLQSKVDFLELKVEGANKEMRILQLSIEQRDNEITRLKSLTRSLQEQIRNLTSQRNEDDTSPKTLGGISLQRMNRLLMARSPNKAEKENIQSLSNYQSSSLVSPSKMRPQANKKQYEMPTSHPYSPNYDGWFKKSPKKSPNRRVTFLESQHLREKDVSEWARTDTLRKGQQVSTGDLISSGISRHTQDSFNEISSERPDDEVVPNLSLSRDDFPQQGDKYRFNGLTLVSDHDQAELNSFKMPFEVPTNPETVSIISDSTMSSVTSQYESQFQMGLRNLDAEIGKLQASLKYSTYKS